MQNNNSEKVSAKIKRLTIFKKSRIALSVLVDLVACILSFLLSYWVCDGFKTDEGYLWSFYAVSAVVTVLSLLLFRCYRMEWRYAGILEMVSTVLAFVASFCVGLILILTPLYNGIPVTFMFIYYFATFVLCTLYRLAPRVVVALKKQFNIEQNSMENVVIYGAGYTGAMYAKRLHDNPQDGLNPVAFIDDDEEKLGRIVSGVRIVGNYEALTKTVKTYAVSKVVIAITKGISKERILNVITKMSQLNVPVQIASIVKDAKNELNKDSVSIKDFSLEDLLHREEHKIDMELLESVLKDKVIMVTGGAGSIGSEICRQALLYGCKQLIIYDHSEFGMFEMGEELKEKYAYGRYILEIGSVRDVSKVKTVMDRYKPDVVFHAAAYKHVPMMELSADESVKNNIVGTENVIDCCELCGVKKFILISTDKAINPSSVMGATKRIAELVLEYKAVSSKTQLSAVRFGNVLGSSGSVIPTFLRQINARKDITVTHPDMRRYFMTIPEAVRLVVQAGGLAKAGDVFVLDMGEPVYIKELAQDLIRISGLELGKDINIKYTGLRDGEKLFEELSYNGENTDKTAHGGIFTCKLAKVDEGFPTQLEELKALAASGDAVATERKIFEIVPSEYRKKQKGESK